MKQGDIVEVVNPVSLHDGHIGTICFVFGVTAVVDFDGKEAHINVKNLELVKNDETI